MHEYKEQGQAHDSAEGWCVGKAPGECGKKKEEGEEVGERGIGPVPGVFCFWETRCQYGGSCEGGNGEKVPIVRALEHTYVSITRSVSIQAKAAPGPGVTYMVIYRLEDLLGRNQQRRHFPDGHFKVHLRELEESNRELVSWVFWPGLSLEPFEEARHADAGAAARHRAEIDGTGMLTGDGDVRVHGARSGQRGSFR